MCVYHQKLWSKILTGEIIIGDDRKEDGNAEEEDLRCFKPWVKPYDGT